MMELYKSFNQIDKEESAIVNFFKDKVDFHAHTHSVKKSETLHQHIVLVKKCFLRLIEINKLESIVDGIINSISLESFP